MEKKILSTLRGHLCRKHFGACMFIKDFIEIGLFDEIFFILFSDENLCRKLKK